MYKGYLSSRQQQFKSNTKQQEERQQNRIIHTRKKIMWKENCAFKITCPFNKPSCKMENFNGIK
jgi:hypothetical protein